MTYKLKNTLLLIFCCCSFISAFAQGTGSLKGVIRSQNGQLLAGATIFLEPDRHIAKTDTKGVFTFQKLYPGVYQMQIQFVGHQVYVDSISIKAGSSNDISITLLEEQQSLSEVSIVEKAADKPSVDNLIQLKRSAMPVQVITRRTIELMGSRRLDEVLKEQTGIAIVNNIGGGSRSVGVQMQGFGSEYVMVLIDGQPMVGRNNGNFDLSRISISNIERIEIVKGASSCLFGSDAMGGAINIITRHGAIEPQLLGSLNYGSLNIVDATLDGELPFDHQRGTITLSGNYYRTDGFNTNPYLSNGVTGPPYDNYAIQTRVRYRTSKNSTVGTSVRYGLRKSFMAKEWGDNLNSGDSQDEKDLNLSLTFDHTFPNGLRSMSRYYFTQYQTNEFFGWQANHSNTAENVFKQNIHRFEQQFAHQYRNGVQLTGGLGAGIELMQDNAIEGDKTLGNVFAYLQGEKRFFEKLDVMGGVRFDHTKGFGGRINPSLGLQYQLNEQLTFKTGVGTGFKAPDFRMRYQVFFNPTANYLVIGNELLNPTLQQMWADGLLSEVRQYLVSEFSNGLQAEKSVSYNAGLVWKPTQKLKAEASVFYHHLRNQINPIMVATGAVVGQIYTYQNLPKAVNKGFEMNMSWSPLKALELQFGYQYLIAKDLSVIDSIRVGNWPYSQNIHDPATGNSYSPKPSDYWGIENRSRHMANVRASYQIQPLKTNVSLRANYRGKYPFMDVNLNQFIDRFDTFVPEHILLNATIEKKFLREKFTLRLAIDNILDFTNMYMPGQPGRLFITGISYRWSR